MREIETVPSAELSKIRAIALDQVFVGIVDTKVRVALDARFVVKERQGIPQEFKLLMLVSEALELCVDLVFFFLREVEEKLRLVAYLGDPDLAVSDQVADAIDPTLKVTL